MITTVAYAGDVKKVRSPGYNYNFDRVTGRFERWGKTKNDDPLMAPAPEIADIEVTTACRGVNGKVCSHCYKSNTPKGEYMTLETFKRILSRLQQGDILTQVALGADATCETNPEIFDIMQHCRDQGIVPNITVADVTEETAQKLAELCGAVAVSRYDDADACYDTVERLTRAGLSQVNIHAMVSHQTFDRTLQTIVDAATDPRLRGLKAIVLLSLKRKGRGITHKQLDQERFDVLVAMATKLGVQIGFDSCSAKKYLDAIKHSPLYEKIKVQVEPCESTIFSIYVNVRGEAFPCSFTEGLDGWEKGIDLTKVENFAAEVWYNNDRFTGFRKDLCASECKNEHKCRECPLYDI